MATFQRYWNTPAVPSGNYLLNKGNKEKGSKERWVTQKRKGFSYRDDFFPQADGNVIIDPTMNLRKTSISVSTISLKGRDEMAGEYNHDYHGKHHTLGERAFWSQIDQGLLESWFCY